MKGSENFFRTIVRFNTKHGKSLCGAHSYTLSDEAGKNIGMHSPSRF